MDKSIKGNNNKSKRNQESKEENSVNFSIKQNEDKKEVENNPAFQIKTLIERQSYEIFETIFKNLKYKDINGEDIKIKGYDDFYYYQIKLNSYYMPSENIDFKNKENIAIIKECPYNPIKLRMISAQDSEIYLSPNRIFARTKKIKKFESSLEIHYINIIGYAILVNDKFYYEVEILELGEDTGLIFGIISYDSLVCCQEKYRNN